MDFSGIPWNDRTSVRFAFFLPTSSAVLFNITGLPTIIFTTKKSRIYPRKQSKLLA
jgi:hypothetical protein